MVDEIRMVYNATKSSLNKVVYAPWFRILAVESHLIVVEGGIYMADCGVEEMILNLMIEPTLRPHAGIT